MSESQSEGGNRREIAYRLFAAEYDEADLSYSEGDEERAPNYVVTPTGARVNRAFFVGVLTEVEAVSEDVLRARVVDPTGAFVLYAGQYQPDEQAFLDGADTPTFVAVTGKARTFQPEDADRTYTSIRPETINEVDADTRDRWTVGTAERTLQRVGWMARAIASDRSGGDLESALVADGADEGFASGIVRALDHYGTSPAYLSALAEMATDAARLVAGETDEVETVSMPPGAAGEADLDALARYADLATVHGGEPSAKPSVAGTSDAELTGSEDSGQTEASAESPAQAATSAVGGGTASDSGSDGTERSGGSDTSTEADAAGDAPAVQTTETATASTDPDASDGTDAEPADPVSGGNESVDTDGSVSDVETGESGETTEVGDFEPGEFDLDDEEREEIEEEFGTEFQSGTEVDEPGEADIETQDPEPTAAESSAGEKGSTAAAESPPTESEASAAETTTADSADQANGAVDSTEAVETSDTETGAEDAKTGGARAETADSEPDETETRTDDAASDDVDLEDATVDVMAELDDGDGADRQAVIEATVDRYGVSSEAVEEAIQDALMDGRCYEPDDASLKPI